MPMCNSPACRPDVRGMRTRGVTYWTSIAPEDAVGFTLPRAGIIGPLNEDGMPCPWPWDSQWTVVGEVPVGSHYPCSYCGAVVVAGLPHLDYRSDRLSTLAVQG